MNTHTKYSASVEKLEYLCNIFSVCVGTALILYTLYGHLPRATILMRPAQYITAAAYTTYIADCGWYLYNTAVWWYNAYSVDDETSRVNIFFTFSQCTHYYI